MNKEYHNRREGAEKQTVSAGRSTPVGDLNTTEAMSAANLNALLDSKLAAITLGASHYAILELGPDASSVDVKSRYRDLAMIYHPDRHLSRIKADPLLKGRLEKVFARIIEAYEVLQNEDA